ncbi:acid protease [Trametes meyenii]|nr:acid protease [Trametes meyenii]
MNSLSSILLFLLVSLFRAVRCQPLSLSVDIHGTGAKFLNGLIASYYNPGVNTRDNNAYFTNITLGGLNLTVLLDTGSSDLIVDLRGRQSKLNTTNIQAEAGFGKGSVVGTIEFADLQLGGLVVHSQAFLSAGALDNLGETRDGILGLSFDEGSNVQSALTAARGANVAQTQGRTPMPALFAQQPGLNRSFDVRLGRTSALEDVAPGTFIIGGHDKQFVDQIEGAPRLYAINTDHWDVVMDGMIVDGKPFKFNASRVTGSPVGKVVAGLDTGFSRPPLPPAAVDAIYKSMGGTFDKRNGQWFVSCKTAGDVAFIFANSTLCSGQKFVVHPLDLSTPVVGIVTDGSGHRRTACVNTYQYLTLDPESFVGFDLILGDAFLRNAYVSFNYGNNQSDDTPYVQMVSTTTDLSAAKEEFNEQRNAALAKLPPTIEPYEIVNVRVLSTSKPYGKWHYVMKRILDQVLEISRHFCQI